MPPPLSETWGTGGCPPLPPEPPLPPDVPIGLKVVDSPCGDVDGASIIGRMTPAAGAGAVVTAAGVDAVSVAFAVASWVPAGVLGTIPPERGDATGGVWGRGFTVGTAPADGVGGVESVIRRPPARVCDGPAWAVDTETVAQAGVSRPPGVAVTGRGENAALAVRGRLGTATR